MSKVTVHGFSVSLDGFAAGPDQSLERPVGRGGRRLHEWLWGTDTMRRTFGSGGDDRGLDDEVARAGQEGIGATIMGRNMFAPSRGPWTDDDWRGWWGEDPPFHHPVFVLTHQARPPIEMAGGTSFHFVTGGIEDALTQAREAAADRNVRIGGGAATVRQFLRAGLVDEVGLALVPVLLGRGERLFEDLDEVAADYTCASWTASSAAMHVRLVRRAAAHATAPTADPDQASTPATATGGAHP